MPDTGVLRGYLTRIETYLVDALLPFWIERAPDRECGGFLTYFDRDGSRTGETTKTFLMQIRMLYTMASAHRAGYGGGRCGELARMGAEFILDHYWDEQNDGWIWIADRKGNPTCSGKIGYGQVFGVYAFSEYALATGDERGLDAAIQTYAAICNHMADTQRGGLFELCEPDWRPAPPGKGGGDRKSLDVHMHMMEALTDLYELTRHPTHRRRLLEVIELITTRMLDPRTRLGYIQFSLDFEPLPAILFDVQWGRDAEPADGQARPLNHTSYGHNMEFLWLLLHAADVLGQPRETYRDIARAICDHCVRCGVDHELGGVFAEGPMDGPTTLTEKQFWQHPEVMIGLLDALAMFGDETYWDAFTKVTDFVFDKFINFAGGGEWYERLDREGNVVDGDLGHGWKISYHTVRGMIQSTRRLRALVGERAQ